MKIGSLAVLLAMSACASAPPRPLTTPASGLAPATPPPIVAPPAGDDVPASVLDERRRAAEDPTRACLDNDVKTCHWVDVWRRHAIEQLHLPSAWLDAHTTVDFILMNDTPDMASFTIQWTVTIDWVRLPIQELVVRGAPGASFDTDDAVLARYAALEQGGDGYHVFDMKPWTRLVARDTALHALATCHGAGPPPDNSVAFADDKHVVMSGSAELPTHDFYHCFVGTVDLETGKLLSCGEMLCRQD